MIQPDFSKIHVKSPAKLHIGSAGIPLSTIPHNTVNGLKRIKELKLEAMELEFVRNVNVNPVTAKQLLEENKDQSVMLTCHGSYFINLNAADKDTIIASKHRILEGAMMARLAGAWSMTFHAAYYLKDEKSMVYERTKEQIQSIVSELQDAGNDIWIRPETTGKETQFGNIKELIQMSQELEQVLPCVDFAHLHARTNGKYNSTAEFREILTMVEKGLGREGLNNMHIHMSGINYGEKGEKNHLILKESDFHWQDLLKVWKEFRIKGAVINESPNIEDDAVLMKEYWDGLK
jgi:deoxyribonuclease-4